MAETTYAYSLAADFGGAINTGRLAVEIAASAIVIALERIDTSGDVASVVFKAALSVGDKTLLDSVVAAHDSSPTVKAAKLVSIDGPKTSDGKTITTTARFPGDQTPFYPGVGDDVTAGTRGGGAAFVVDQTLNGVGTTEFQFIDYVYMASGHAYAYNGALGDSVTFELVFPATPAVANAGAGNCNLVPVGGGLNVIIPAAGDGSHDVDVAVALNANLDAKPRGLPTKVTKACPVPAFDAAGLPNGYWDMGASTGEITANALGAGAWNLFDAEIVEVRWVTDMPIPDPGKLGRELNIEVDTKAKKILPHWIFRVLLKTTDDQREVHLDWFLKSARKVLV